MENISFGQYYPGNSWIYRLDPRLKIILTIFFMILLFIIPVSTNGLYMMCIALGLFVLMFLTTRIPLIRVLKGIKPVLFLVAFTTFLQLVYTVPENEIALYSFSMQIGLFQTLIIVFLVVLYFLTSKYIKFKFIYLLIIAFIVFMVLWKKPFELYNWNFILGFKDFEFNVYQAGVNKAAFMFIRIVLLIGITSLLTLSTMSTDINNGLEAVLSPLKIFKIPVGVFSMLISLTLRFIPTLMIESKKIMNAQASRGVDFSEGTLKDKANQIIALLIPMFVISFKRAEDLSNAMEARGYVIGAKRTKIDELKFRAVDYIVIVLSLIVAALVILGRIYF